MKEELEEVVEDKLEETIKKVEKEREEVKEKIHSRKKNSEDIEKVYYANQPKLGKKKGTSKLRQHFNRGITAFLVIAAAIAFYFVLLRFPDLSDLIRKVIGVLMPVIFGFVIAFLLNPLVKLIEKFLTP